MSVGGLSIWSLVCLTSFVTWLRSPFTCLLHCRPGCCCASGFVDGVIFTVCFSENWLLGFREVNDFCQSCVLPCDWIGFLVLDVLSELLGISVIESYHLPSGRVLLSCYLCIYALFVALAVFFWFKLQLLHRISKSGQSSFGKSSRKCF